MIKNGRSRGIKHLEDLPFKELQNAMNHIQEYVITEKVDGSEILFGIDNTGFYTSREMHGGKRIYNVDDYELTFSNTYKRSAHLALEQALPQMQLAGLKIGDQVEAEVLYGEVPNVVPYSPNMNFVIFLRTTEGSVDINLLTDKLAGYSTDISLLVPYTPDGIQILNKIEKNTWLFSRTPVIFNSIPTYISKFKSPIDIKNAILEDFVRERTSAFGPPTGWIEGIVLANPITGHRFKVIDKDVFLAEKNHQWKYRDELMEYPRSPKYANSIFGKLLVEMAEDLGHDVLGTIMAKKYLRNMGENTEQRLEFILSTSSRLIDLTWVYLIRKTITLLEIKFKEFNKELENIDHGLTDNTIKRTYETFALLLSRLNEMEYKVRHSKTSEECIMVLIGKQLAELENESMT